MQAIKISVTGNEAAVTNFVPITGGMVGLPVEFSFDESWEGLEKTAVFRCGNLTLDRLYLEGSTTVPWELTKKIGCRMLAGVYGCSHDGSLQIPTVWADLGAVLPGADPTGDESADPTLPVWKQAFDSKESIANRVTSIDENADDAHYPTAKAVADFARPDLCVRAIPTITLKLGESVLSDDNLTLGEGWSGSLREGFTHIAGYTQPLTFDIGSEDGEKFLVSGKLAGANVSALRLQIGNSYPTDPYGSNPWIWGVESVGGGSLTITPVSNWAGTLSMVDCCKITQDGPYEIQFAIDNIAQEEMANHIAGFWDIAMGKNALGDSINTTRCIAIGKESLSRLKTGGRNIGLGTFTLPAMTYGEDNVAIGADSGLYVQQAHGCVSIGKSAMSNGKTYTDCVAIGHGALYGKSGAEPKQNIAIGTCAGQNVTTATNNILIGNNAGYNTSSGYCNTYIGASAAKDATTAYFNTVVGRNAVIPAGARNCVVLGDGAVATESYQAVFGGDTVKKTLLKGDLIVRGTDGVKRQIVFDSDGTCSWVAV